MVVIKEIELKYKKGIKVQESGINDSETATAVFKKLLSREITESMMILFLDCKNCIIGYKKVGQGALNELKIAGREIFIGAVYCNARSIIIGHNHPSLNASPSPEDREFTKKIIEVGDILGVHLLDHIIVGGEDSYSFASEEDRLWKKKE